MNTGQLLDNPLISRSSCLHAPPSKLIRIQPGFNPHPDGPRGHYINSGPGDRGPEEPRTRGPGDPQLLRETEIQLQVKTHGYIIAWNLQVSLAQIGRHFQHTALSSSLSPSLFHLRRLSDTNVPRSPALRRSQTLTHYILYTRLQKSI